VKDKQDMQQWMWSILYLEAPPWDFPSTTLLAKEKFLMCRSLPQNWPTATMLRRADVL
jgi:hypothetical protein